MGRSKSINDALAQSEKNRLKFDEMTLAMKKEMDNSRIILVENKDKYYGENKWIPSPYLSGGQSDFMTSSSWGLDRVATMIQAISDAVVGSITGSVPVPPGTDVAADAQQLNKSGGISSDMRVLVAVNVSNLLQGLVRSFGKCTALKASDAVTDAPVGQGLHIFVRISSVNAQEKGFFNDEITNSYQFSYLCFYCLDEFKRDGEMSVLKQYNDSLTANGIASKRNLEAYQNKEITYRQYLADQKMIADQAVELSLEISRLGKMEQNALPGATDGIRKTLSESIKSLSQPLFVAKEDMSEMCDYKEAIEPGLQRLKNCLASHTS